MGASFEDLDVWKAGCRLAVSDAGRGEIIKMVYGLRLPVYGW
jgi:hypothetical protein